MTHTHNLYGFKTDIENMMKAFNNYSKYAQLSDLTIHEEAQGFFDNKSGGSLLWEYPRHKSSKNENKNQDFIQTAITKINKQATKQQDTQHTPVNPDGVWECYLVQMNAAICEAVHQAPYVHEINLYGIPSHYADKVISIPGEYSKELQQMEERPKIYVENFDKGSDYNPFIRTEYPYLPYCRYTNKAYPLENGVSVTHILSIGIEKTPSNEEKNV